ncbi:MAG: penicillin-binding transpeptidase domain-containing protein [Clostridia bacterium]
MQLFSNKKLSVKALDQWTRDLPIQASRGKIYDRNGVILADNLTTYDIYVRPRMVKESDVTARELSRILSIEYESIYKKLTAKGSSEFTLKRGIDEKTMKEIVNLNLSGIYYSISNKRYYPYNELACQVLGYVSIDGDGQSGLEKYYNEYLRGIDGKLLSQGDLLGVEGENDLRYYVEGQSGLDLYLTIDKDIQAITENALKKVMLNSKPLSTSAMVMDVNSGEVVAMANLPDFDLNKPPRDDIELLMKLSRNTLATDIYEPGSTFKVLTASANIEEYLKGNKNAFSPTHIFSGSSIRVVDGQTIKCWDKHLNGRHQQENLQMALQNSCNPVFVDIALALKKEKFYDYLELFGYGKQTGIDYIGEASGMIINENFVKNCDLARIGFGQTIAVTGLQLINATAAAVNGGILNQPTLLKEVKTKENKLVYRQNQNVLSRPISEKTSEIMRKYLQNVVENGSGSHALVDGVAVGGKTGTAQKYVNGHIAQGKYISSFVGFFPAEKPQYICLVLVDEPIGIYYGSVISAPVAKEIIEGILSLDK